MEWLKWLKLGFFVLRMLKKWGPKAWKLGNRIYHDIEAKRHDGGRPYSSDESATAYNQKGERVLAGAVGRAPNHKTLNALREDVWQRNNMGRDRKPLENARLRNMPPRGKAKRRRRP